MSTQNEATTYMKAAAAADEISLLIWPKTLKEYIRIWLNFSGSIAMLVCAISGSCPSIPTSRCVLIVTGIVLIFRAVREGFFGISTPEYHKKYPFVKWTDNTLLVGMLILTVWLAILFFPRADLWSEASKHTCTTGILIGGWLTPLITGLVILLIMGYIIKIKLFGKNEDEKNDDEHDDNATELDIL